MTNDTSTLNGALQELGETMASNLQAKGVTASASDGLTTLAGKILTIPSGGSCYHIEFSEDSYTAVGGTATLEIMLQENYAPKVGATVTVTGSDSSLYSGITNSSGIASVTVSNISAETTFTASYSNVSDTCIVSVPSYLFYDGGVTGNVNTNYTDLNGTIVTTVSSNGTNIACQTYADCFRKPNINPINGDFKIRYDLVQLSGDGGGFGFLDSNNTNLYYFEFTGTRTNWNGTNVSTGTGVGETITLTKVGTTLSLYYGDTLKHSRTVSFNNVVPAWKTHNAGGRNYTFKDFTIEAL